MVSIGKPVLALGGSLVSLIRLVKIKNLKCCNFNRLMIFDSVFKSMIWRVFWCSNCLFNLVDWNDAFSTSMSRLPPWELSVSDCSMKRFSDIRRVLTFPQIKADRFFSLPGQSDTYLTREFFFLRTVDKGVGRDKTFRSSKVDHTEYHTRRNHHQRSAVFFLFLPQNCFNYVPPHAVHLS